MEFIKQLLPLSQKINTKIVYPETEDNRTIEAIEIIIKKKITKPILIGDSKKLLKKLKKRKINLSKVEIIDPNKFYEIDKLVKRLYKLRKNKGMTLINAKKILLTNKIFFGTMLVEMGYADGLISGATHTTAETIRPALKVIKTKKRNNVVSGLFFMELQNKIYIFADCAVNIKPNAQELAKIAIQSAETAKNFKINPKVAMLSFSTKGSAKHEDIEKVKKATSIAKKFAKNKFKIDGEMQVDAAIVPSVCKSKCKDCALKGDANVLIFPDLNAGNISYKLVERLAKAKAIGPVLQGLKKPINDLSRGCSVNDIVELSIITAIQTQH